MATPVDAPTVKSWISDGGELAFIDVREYGQYGEAHPFFVVSAPYSRLELDLPRLAPRRGVRMVLLDDGDGVALRAAAHAADMGYGNVHVLDGGAPGWRQAGYTLFAGVNVPSKTFGELIEHARHTPRISAAELVRQQRAGERLVIVDGRPVAEFERMSIPGGICCPNGELSLRIDAIAPDPATRIVVNCAGRTRSIIGAQTLIDLGVPNEVVALENGTQGWFLAGLELERGAQRRYGDARLTDAARQERAAKVLALARARGAGLVAAGEVARWLADTTRTTFLLDVRTPEEFAAGSAPGFVSAPGGQLIQATDQWVGVHRARLVLADSDGVRAPMTAQWLAQLGHEVHVLDGGIAAAKALPRAAAAVGAGPALLEPMSVREAALAVGGGIVAIVDLRGSMAYRKSHIPNAIWSIRPRLERIARLVADRLVIVVADSPEIAALAAPELATARPRDMRVLDGGMAAWSAAGLPTISTADRPADEECIDFLFFVHDRHDGNAEAARRYLEWETGLLAQLDEQERSVFRIAPA